MNMTRSTKCYLCKTEVDLKEIEDLFCYGCNNLICEKCDVNPTLPLGLGGHTPEDHLGTVSWNDLKAELLAGNRIAMPDMALTMQEGDTHDVFVGMRNDQPNTITVTMEAVSGIDIIYDEAPYILEPNKPYIFTITAYATFLGHNDVTVRLYNDGVLYAEDKATIHVE